MTIHQHFEDLIFSGKSLTSDEQNDLVEHLMACPECKSLHRSWQEIHKQIQSVQVVLPSANFVQRWSLGLENRKLHARSMQTRKMLLFSFIGTVMAFLITLGLTFMLASPADLLIGIVKSLNNFVLLINLLHTFSMTVLKLIPPIIPFYYTLVITSTFCLLTFLWIFSIWRLSRQGVYTK